MISIHADSSAVFRAEAKPRCGNPGPRDKAWIAIISGQLGVRYVGLTDTCKNQGVEENRRCTLKILKHIFSETKLILVKLLLK